MIVLDTNVVSELMRPAPAPPVIEWLDRRSPDQLWLTAITVAELLYGIGRLPAGRRKAQLASQVDAMIVEDFGDRVASFDTIAAAHYADIVVARERSGLPVSMADAQIASICRSHGAALATRNASDFEGAGITLVNPWIER